MSTSRLVLKPNVPISSMGAVSHSTAASKRPLASTAAVVAFSLLMATISFAGSAVTCVTVFTTHP